MNNHHPVLPLVPVESVCEIFSLENSPISVKDFFATKEDWLAWVFPRYIYQRHTNALTDDCIIGMLVIGQVMAEDPVDSYLYLSFVVDVLRSSRLPRIELELWLGDVVGSAVNVGLAGFAENISQEFCIPKPEPFKLVFVGR